MRTALLVTLTLALPTVASAELVEIKWNSGTFLHKTSIAPKKFLELCGQQKKGDAVTWKFNASGPTDFNIHYHVGQDVIYPENRKDIAEAKGLLTASLDQGFCWMWSNTALQVLEIDVQLQQVGSTGK